jgi:sirohydrochlorin cobaltochelatase
MSGTRSTSTRAPATDRRLAGAALVVCSYGSGGCAIARRLDALGRDLGVGQTAAATLFGTPRIETIAASLGGSPIVVVPLFMAQGVTYGTLKERLSGLHCRDRIVLCPELGGHPGLARRLAAHAGREAARLGWDPMETGLLLVGHGSRRNEASKKATERLAAEVRALVLFADASAGFLEEAPTVEEAVQTSRARQVLAVGCFTESGRHATQDVPARLRRSGRSVAYSGPIGAYDWIDTLVLDQARHGLRRFAEREARLA